MNSTGLQFMSEIPRSFSCRKYWFLGEKSTDSCEESCGYIIADEFKMAMTM
jgi:hypothetical protein